MNKRILALLLALVMVLGLAACSSKETTEQQEETTTTETTETTKTETPAVEESTETETVTLRWVGAGWSMNDKANKIIAKWNENHPEIQVEYIELGSSADEDYMKNLDTMIAGGEVVDVTYLTYEDVYKRVMSGGALALDEYIEAAGDDFDALYGTMSSAMLEYEGSIYGVPWSGNTFKVFYNKTMTDAAGIEIPETWSIEEFTEVAKQLNDPDNGVYGCVFPYTWDSVSYCSAELSGFQFAKRLEDGTVVPNYDDEAFMTCLQWARDLAAVEGVAPDLATMKSESLNRRQALALQQAAMIIDGPYTLVWLQNYMFNDPGEGMIDFELGVTDIPYVTEEGKDVSYNTLVGGFYVPKTSAYPAEAYAFISFVCQECAEEGANYMPVYTGADMVAATTAFTNFVDSEGVEHTDIYPEEVAIGAVATPNESHIGRYNYDPNLASHNSVLYTLFSEQYSLFMNGEMELDEWVEMMMSLGEAELASLN